MAFQPCPNIVEAVVVGRLDGQLIENVLHFLKDGSPPNATDVADVASFVGDWYIGGVLPLISNLYTLVQVKTEDLTVQGSWQTTLFFDEVGGATGGVEPNMVALCVSFHGLTGGRASKGRNFVPAIPQGVVTQNTVNAIDLNQFIAAYGQLAPFGGATPDPWVWVVLSREFEKVKRPEGVGYPVAAVTVSDNILDTQRRRGPGRGA
jgi:hypothetical protein